VCCGNKKTQGKNIFTDKGLETPKFLSTEDWLKNKICCVHTEKSNKSVDKQREKRDCWMPVAHTYNPSYSGGRDQEV
jgi:hypothetical protein